MRWYFDERLYFTSNPSNHPWYPPPGAAWPAPFDQDFYVIMNVGVGGSWPGAPDATTPFPAEMAVDWVRVFRRAPS
jgi:beta-glucanase (GH16 family)